MNEQKETGRIEAFSDGVIAIAITLLALELAPAVLHPKGGLFQEMLQKWPVFAAFATSFATIGIMWMNHHRLLIHIKPSNHIFTLLNLLLLFMICIIPFTTALLGEYSVMTSKTADDAHHIAQLQNEAAILYSGTFFVTAIVFNVFWSYATYKQHLLDSNVDMSSVRSISRQYMIGPVLYGAAFVVAFFSPLISLLLNALLALFFILPGVEIRLKKNAVPVSETTSTGS